MDPILAELQTVFRRVFDDDHLEVTPATTAIDVNGWDSMAHINLIVTVEKQFGVRFTAAELGAMQGPDQNVGKLIELIAAKSNGAG
jgi:acyl carrier protein